MISFVVSCEDDSNFPVTPTTGYVALTAADITTANAPESVSSGVVIEVPIFRNGLTINYKLESVEGNFQNYVTSDTGSIFVGADNVERSSEIVIDLVNTDTPRTELVVFDVVLTSVSQSGVQVGFNNGDDRFRVTLPCVIDPSLVTTYSGDAFSTDLAQAPGSIPAYNVTMVPTPGVDFSWDVTTVWGPDYVSETCGGCVPPGSFPYPGTITVNPDTNMVTVIGGDFYTDGGTGTYDPCTNTFTLNVSQSLFTNPFTVDVVLTGI